MQNHIAKFIGIIVFVIFLYFRLRTRIPHELTFQFSYFYSILVIFFIIINLFALKNIFFPTLNYNNYFMLIIAKIMEKIYYSLHVIFSIFYNKFINPTSLQTINFIQNFTKYTFKYGKYIYFCCFILPQLSLAIILFIDIVIFNYMFYFYKFLFLVWIPIIFRIILYTIDHWANTFKTQILEIFEVIPNISQKKYNNIIKLKIDFVLKKKNNNLKLLLLMEEYRIICRMIYGHENAKDYIYWQKQQKWAKILHIFTYSLNIFTWSYVLYKIIINLIYF